MATLEEQMAVVSGLRDTFYNTQRRLQEAEHTLKVMCKNAGHDYLRERDDDFHSSSYTYTCQRCGAFTRFQPNKFRT